VHVRWDKVESRAASGQMEGQGSLEAAISTASLSWSNPGGVGNLRTAAETARFQAMQDVVTYERAVRRRQTHWITYCVLNQINLDAVEALNQMEKLLDKPRSLRAL